MQNVLLFGASGNLGTAIIEELHRRKIEVTAVVRNDQNILRIASLISGHIIADITKRETLSGICNGYDIVISALGKSVSPNDRSKQTFHEVDLEGNLSILEEAVRSRVKKFVYLSAFHSEKYVHLEYFRVHHVFSEQLKSSGIDYSIIKPPALFSAYTDMIELAEKGRLVSIGSGDKKTNPIYEGDVATICVESMSQKNVVIEAGGRNIYSRKELLEIIQREVDTNKKVRVIPIGIVKFFLPIIKIIDKNIYDKMSFFLEVLQHDTIAPQRGAMSFEDYIKMKLKS